NFRAETDCYMPKINGMPISNYLYENSQIYIDSKGEGVYTFTENFSDYDKWKKRVFFFTGGKGDNLEIHKGGDLGDGALVSGNAMYEDTVIYMIDTRFYPVNQLSITVENISMEDTDIYVSPDMTKWEKWDTITEPIFGIKKDTDFQGPFFIKFHNRESGKWLCLMNMNIEASFSAKNEKTVYYDSINTEKDWEKNFDEIQSDCNVLTYSGADGLIHGDGNANNQYIVKKIKSPKALSAKIYLTSIQSVLEISLSCDGRNWVSAGKNPMGKETDFSVIDANKKLFDDINKNYKDGYYLKIAKGGKNWFALYNFAIAFDTEKTFSFKKLKNNLMFTEENGKGTGEITADL
ncbi:MAG: hypothetical protein KBT47_08000, partial [Armatimonadetes bacterium]|nr:hypothetical protein [Candidatus Hippobium faecium]